jgi:5-methylcytosine-specific restriction endonuclease McrA
VQYVIIYYVKEALKAHLVKEFGGCCVLCGYKKCLAALHFHHINPFEKDFNISSKTNYEDLKEELSKCIILCSNCHIELHNGLVNHDTIAMLAER